MRIPLVLALLALCAPALASETPWQDISPGVRMRVISDDVRKADGTTMLGLEIEMPQNTKTYWRVPGETGIPAQFDASGSTGVVGLTPMWPYPAIDHTGGFTDYVYYGPTVLPIAAQVDADASNLNLAVTLGICSDICVPVAAKFALSLSFGKPDAGQKIRLEQALAQAPLPWPGPGDAFGEVGLDAQSDGILVSLADPQVDADSVIADVDTSGLLFGTPQKSRDGRLLTLPLLGSGDIKGLLGKPVRLTFMTPMGAYEATRIISASGPAEAQ